MSNECEKLKRLRLEAARLLPRGYVLLEGLSPSRHKLAYKFADDHQELVTRLERKFPKHPRDINWDKADKYAGTTLVRHCVEIVQSLKSDYAFFEDLAWFQKEVLEMLSGINQNLGPVTFRDGPNDIVFDWMALFCDLISLHILAQKTQKEKIIQIYAAAYYAQKREDPPHHSTVCTMVTNIASNPIQHFQNDLSQFSLRIKQILELVACPILSRFDSTLSICQSGVLALPSDQIDHVTLKDVTDLDISRSLLLKFLMDYKTLERWILFGTLVCPGICRSPQIRSCLTNLLSRTHHLPIFRDVHEPIHVLFKENIYSKLVELYDEEKNRLMRTPIGLQESDMDAFQTADFTSITTSWKDARSELSSKHSVSSHRTDCRRSFAWRPAKTDRFYTRSCKSFGSMLATSFTFSEKSADNSPAKLDDSVEQGDQKRTGETFPSQSEDFKTLKQKAKREIREFIAQAEMEANASAQRHRVAGWFCLTHLMKDILLAAEAEPETVVHQLDLILTILSLAQSEIMWKVVHSSSQLVVPQRKREAFHFKEKQQEAQKNKKPEDVDGMHAIGKLIEMTVSLQLLLLKYRSSICYHKIHAIKIRYRRISYNLTSALHRFEKQVEVDAHLIEELQTMKEWVDAMTFQSQHNFDSEDSDDQRSTTPSRARSEDEPWTWDLLSEFRDSWKAIEFAFSNMDSAVNIGTLLQLGCEGDFVELKQVVMDVLQISDLIETISDRSSLKELAFYELEIQSLIQLNFAEGVTTESSFNVLSLFYVFSQFHKNNVWADDPFNRGSENEYVEIAEKCGMQLLMRLEEFLRDMLTKCTLSCLPNNRHSSHSQMVDLLSYWFSVLGRFGTVEVVPTFVLNAAEFLNNTIVNNLKELLLDHGLQDDGMGGFEHMKDIFFHFTCLLSEMQSTVEFDILSSIYAAISGLIHAKDHQFAGSRLPFTDSIASESDTTPCYRDMSAFGDQCVVSLLGDSMSTNIIRDLRNLGIIFDPRKRRFMRKESDAQPEVWTGVRCSLQDFRALVSVFGSTGVQLLEVQFRALIYESIGKLDDYLKGHSEMLKHITSAFSSDKDLIDSPALNHLANQLQNLPAVIDITLQFSRSLLIRQLLSDAYALQMHEVEQNSASGGTSVTMPACQLGLPEPTQPHGSFPCSPEPVMVQIFQESMQANRLENWMYVPALFSCLVHAMIPGAKSFNPESCTFSNGMHQIVFTLNSIAYAMDVVYRHRDGQSSTSDRSFKEKFTMLFAKCLAMFTSNSKEKQSTISDTCLVLHALCGDVLTEDQLEQIGLTHARVQSAHIVAHKKHTLLTSSLS